MYDSMIRLAFIQVPNHKNQTVGIPVDDIAYVQPVGDDDSQIHFRSGREPLPCKDTPAEVVAKIEAKWDEWLEAFPA